MQNARILWSKTKDLAAGKPIIQGDMMEEVWALKDVNFEITRGEAIGIIGRNGAGKSTILRTICGLTKPKKGKILLEGEEITFLETVDRVRRGIVYCPEGRKLYVVNRGSDSVSVVDKTTSREEKVIPVGKKPYGIAMFPF